MIQDDSDHDIHKQWFSQDEYTYFFLSMVQKHKWSDVNDIAAATAAVLLLVPDYLAKPPLANQLP